jgi:hypothetical protein
MITGMSHQHPAKKLFKKRTFVEKSAGSEEAIRRKSFYWT